MISAIKYVIMIFVILIWSFVGLMLWIPLLARILAVYVAIIMASTFSGQDTSGAGKMLDKATTFYLLGFQKIIKSVWEEDDRESYSLQIEWSKFFAQIIFTVFLWGLVALLIYW